MTRIETHSASSCSIRAARCAARSARSSRHRSRRTRPRTTRCATTPAPKRWPCAFACRARRRACISRRTTAPSAMSMHSRATTGLLRCATPTAGTRPTGAPANALPIAQRSAGSPTRESAATARGTATRSCSTRRCGCCRARRCADPKALAEARVELPAGYSISAPWHPLPSADGDTRRFAMPQTPDDGLARIAIGRFDRSAGRAAGRHAASRSSTTSMRPSARSSKSWIPGSPRSATPRCPRMDGCRLRMCRCSSFRSARRATRTPIRASRSSSASRRAARVTAVTLFVDPTQADGRVRSRLGRGARDVAPVPSVSRR